MRFNGLTFVFIDVHTSNDGKPSSCFSHFKAGVFLVLKSLLSPKLPPPPHIKSERNGGYSRSLCFIPAPEWEPLSQTKHNRTSPLRKCHPSEVRLISQCRSHYPMLPDRIISGTASHDTSQDAHTLLKIITLSCSPNEVVLLASPVVARINQ